MNTNLKTTDKIILFIPKKVIEANDYLFVLSFFDDILKDPELIRKFKNQVTIGFDGYDNESKEVFENSQIRNFIQHLTLKFPLWFYFLNLDDHSLGLMMIILCKFEKLHDGWKVRIKPEDFDEVTVHLIKELMKFYKDYNLPEEESIPQIGRILERLARIKDEEK